MGGRALLVLLQLLLGLDGRSLYDIPFASISIPIQFNGTSLSKQLTHCIQRPHKTTAMTVNNITKRFTYARQRSSSLTSHTNHTECYVFSKAYLGNILRTFCTTQSVPFMISVQGCIFQRLQILTNLQSKRGQTVHLQTCIMEAANIAPDRQRADRE